jgi:tetratricopeptide (TPR) repeat protein
VGLSFAPGTGSWRTRSLLADIHQGLGDVAGALAVEDRMFVDLPMDLRRNVAFQAGQLAISAGEFASARTWLVRATAEAGEDLDAQLAVLQLRLAIPGPTPVEYASALESVDAAIATRDWQAAYDAVLALPLGSTPELARVLYIASRLQEQGAPDAALDVLGRALDVYPRSAPLYWLLIGVFTDVERVEDALAAVEVLRQLPAGPEAALAA